MNFARRTIDVVLAGAALVLLLPVLLSIAAWLAIDGAGPVLYAETRLGRGARPFRVHKFRTLRAGSAVAPEVAVPSDVRITRPGRWLRRWRLDELPQLGDVLRGAMSLVGPRPQTEGNLSALDAPVRERLLSVRPGLTSRASLAHLGEDDVLAEVADPVHCYRTVLVPAKARLELEDLERRSLARDLLVLLQTIAQVPSPRARARSRQRVRALLGSCAVKPGQA
ncbi:MAG TPA: sugar transferase [Planctomycetota bacterium]|nr:sugar transferase [Planctomycetota bacterium]